MKTIDELGISPTPWDERVRFDVNELVSTDKDGHTQVVFAWTKDVINKRTPNNARLIAAAPELYEALRDAVNAYCSDCEYCSCDPNNKCTDTDDTCQVKKWRTALAKASGEEVK